MKHALLLIFILLALSEVDAQVVGPGMEYTYTNGYRVKREYNANAVLNKPGKNGKQPADTIVVVQKQNNDENLLNAKPIVKAYPNPVYNNLYVEHMENKEGSYGEVRLFDMSGREIVRKNLLQQKDVVQIGDVPPGNYNLSYYANGIFTISWKITKL